MNISDILRRPRRRWVLACRRCGKLASAVYSRYSRYAFAKSFTPHCMCEDGRLVEPMRVEDLPADHFTIVWKRLGRGIWQQLILLK